MPQAKKLVLHPSASESVNGNSDDFDNVIADGPGVLYIDTTVVNGTTPTLDFVLEEKDPESGQYHDSGLTIAQIIAVGIARYEVPEVFGVIYRLAWTIGGTAGPNMTFSAVFVVKDRG